MNVPAWLAGWDREAVVWAAAMLRACWQGGLALAIVWLICQSFPAISPTLRSWLWRLAYLKLVLSLLIAPISLAVLPASASAPPVAETRDVRSPEIVSTQTAPASDAPVSVPQNVAVPPAPSAPPPFRPGVSFWLSLVWLVGCIWCLTRIAGEWIAAGWLRGISEPVEDDSLTACCAELSERIGLRNAPRLLVSEGAGSPVLLGGANPVIILPLALLTECSPPELELVIAHELAHRRRRDLLWGWLPALAHALFFFFPIEWLAAHEYRLSQEMACDELAIRTTRARVGDYGDALLKVAARHRPNLQSRLVTVGIVESSQILKRRLLAMKEMGSFPPRPGLGVTLVITLGLLACIPWQLTPRAYANVSPANPQPFSAHTGGARPPDSAYRDTLIPTTEAGDENALRYHPKAGETYLYAVKIESESGDTIETMTGNASYNCKVNDENGITFVCGGHLIPTSRTTRGTPVPGNPFLHLRSFGFGGFGLPHPFAGPNEIKIDAQGHLLSTRGDTPLPRALGDLSQLIIETLPSEGTRWEVQNGCAIIVQEEHRLSPFSHFARVEKRTLPASETLAYTLGEAAGQNVVLKKHYELRTNERSFGSPTLEMTGDGNVSFDRQLGMPRTMELKLTMVEHPDRTTTSRIPVTVTYRLLEGDEKEKALHPPPPPQPELKPLAETDRTTILTDLQSPDAFKVMGAANKLANAVPNGDRRSVEKALIAAMEHKNGFARQSVVKALGTWGTRESVPPLIKRLDDESFAVRWAVFEVLGKTKDVRAAEPLAKWLEKDRGFATNALRSMGPVAAPAVAQQLKASDWGMRIDVCHLLKEIGTTREIAALQPVTSDENRLVTDAATEAIKAIQQRSTEKKTGTE